MRSGSILSAAGVALLGCVGCLAFGCSSTSTAPQAPAKVETQEGKQVTPTPFTDNTGESAPTTAESYPAGPYGYVAGTVIPNYQFYGFPNPTASKTALKPISLGDFYNPHAFDKTYQPAAGEQDDRLFPADSPYANAGKAKPTVLLIDVACVWCVPCNDEAQHDLPFKHQEYAACGGEFLLDLHDSDNPGTTATQKDLKNWTTAYSVDYPSTIDPAFRLDAYFEEEAFPSNFILDTTTMKIVAVMAGEAVPGVCSDNQTLCGTAADVAICSGPTVNCGGTLEACSSPSCAGTQLDFWTTLESHLDKTRPGCNL